jgi:hypothetical protein
MLPSSDNQALLFLFQSQLEDRIMKKLLIMGLTIMLTGLAANVMADRGNSYDGHTDRYDRGDRIDQRLKAKGGQVEKRFDRKAERAAGDGNYRKAYRLKKKGEHINRHLDHKGDRLEARFERRKPCANRYHAHRAGACAPRHHSHDDQVNLGVYVPGFWFSGVWHD